MAKKLKLSLPTPGPWVVESQMIYVQENIGKKRGAEKLQNRMWTWVSGAITTPKSELEATARLMGLATELLDLIRQYESWEAELIEDDNAWLTSDVVISGELWDKFTLLQHNRKEVLKKLQEP